MDEVTKELQCPTRLELHQINVELRKQLDDELKLRKWLEMQLKHTRKAERMYRSLFFISCAVLCLFVLAEVVR